MSFHTIKKCLITVDGKKYTKNEISIGDNLMFIHYSKPGFSGKVMIELKKPNKNKELEPAPAPAKQVKVESIRASNHDLRFTWQGLWEDEDTGKESKKSLEFKIEFKQSIDGMRVYLLMIGKPLDGKYKLKSNKKSKTKRRKRSVKKDRKGPSESATKFPVGTSKRGNDGNLWQIQVSKNGVQRWVLNSKKQKGGSGGSGETSESSDCSFCLGPPENKITTPCNHVFCRGRDVVGPEEDCAGLRKLALDWDPRREIPVPCPNCRENITDFLHLRFTREMMKIPPPPEEEEGGAAGMVPAEIHPPLFARDEEPNSLLWRFESPQNAAGRPQGEADMVYPREAPFISPSRYDFHASAAPGSPGTAAAVPNWGADAASGGRSPRRRRSSSRDRDQRRRRRRSSSRDWDPGRRSRSPRRRSRSRSRSPRRRSRSPRRIDDSVPAIHFCLRCNMAGRDDNHSESDCPH